MKTMGIFELLAVGLLVSAFLFSLCVVPVLVITNLIFKLPAWSKVGTFLSYPLLAIVVIAVGVGPYLYADSKGIEEYTVVKWMNIFITAVFVFGSSVRKFWSFRKRWTLWAELCVFLVGHFAFLSRLHWQKGGYFWLLIVVGIPEIALVFFLLGLRFHSDGKLMKQDSA